MSLSQYDQYLVCIGFLKAIESTLPSKSNSDFKFSETLMSLIHTRVVEMLYPNRDFDKQKLYDAQTGMHKLNIPDRIYSILSELYNELPANTLNMSKSKKIEALRKILNTDLEDIGV